MTTTILRLAKLPRVRRAPPANPALSAHRDILPFLAGPLLAGPPVEHAYAVNAPGPGVIRFYATLQPGTSFEAGFVPFTYSAVGIVPYPED